MVRKPPNVSEGCYPDGGLNRFFHADGADQQRDSRRW
jgi:hypothetical protein